MFIVTFVIMLPVTLKSGDPDQRLAGGPRLGILPKLHPDDRRLHRNPYIRTITPRAALLQHARWRLDHLHIDAGRRSICS